MTDIETRLRVLFEEQAATITEADAPDLAPMQVVPLDVHRPRPRARIAYAAAAAVLVVAGIGAVARQAPPQDAAPPGDVSVAAERPTGRAWPLTNDQPLPASFASDELSDPRRVAGLYLRDVVGLGEWPIDHVSVTGDTAVADYVLQDVPAQIFLARSAEGFWFVAGAGTDLLRVGHPVVVASGVDVSMGAGPRTYETGSPVRVRALAADGRLLAERASRVEPPQRGAAGAAAVVRLEWGHGELPAAVAVDVMDDHDGTARTPDAVIGHWAAAVQGPSLAMLPKGVDVRSSQPIFEASGDADDVADAYLRSRFPDRPSPGIEAAPVRTRGDLAFVRWTTRDDAHEIAGGDVVLRRAADAWVVVASTTDAVDLGGVAIAGGRVQGTIRSSDDNTLFADVLDDDGTPVAGAPRPLGVSGATYRFGTAGGPADRFLDLDVAVADGHAPILRVNLVGGTILSISEVRLQPPANAPAG